jgi:hypothetical protein
MNCGTVAYRFSTHTSSAVVISLAVVFLALGCGRATADTGSVAEQERRSVYRLGEDGLLTRSNDEVTGEIAVARRGTIEQLRVVVALETPRRTKVDLQLERQTDAGGERLPLLRDQFVEGRWEFTIRLDKFEGAPMDGIWRIVVGSDSAPAIELEALRLEIREQSK